MQGAQNIVGATRCGCPRLGAHMGAPLQFCNDEDEAQRRRWTFYETIEKGEGHLPGPPLAGGG